MAKTIDKYEKYLNQMQEASIDETVECWAPEQEGDVLMGVILDIERDIGRYHSDLMTLERPNGEPIGVWISQVIRSKMKRLGVRVGDTIGLKYGGMEEVEGGNSYKRFALRLLEKGTNEVAPPFDF